jgi:putative DNA methylase
VEPHQRGYLAYVWEAVARAALEQILGTAEAHARNGATGALEEDARLTALFLWALQSTNGIPASSASTGSNEEEFDEDEDDEEEAQQTKPKGYSLAFDVVRRFAQPLGIHLPEWEGRIIETKKGVVRLLSVSERSLQLFGQGGAQFLADQLERTSESSESAQLALFPDEVIRPTKSHRGRKKSVIDISDEGPPADREVTTLDRIHAAMLLQASGHTNALRTLLRAEQDRGPDFLRLANALSALYPVGTEEKRLLDAMLLAVPR